MKIVKRVNSKTQQQQEQLLYFHGAFLLSLDRNNRCVCHGMSHNLSLDFAKMLIVFAHPYYARKFNCDVMQECAH